MKADLSTRAVTPAAFVIAPDQPDLLVSVDLLIDQNAVAAYLAGLSARIAANMCEALNMIADLLLNWVNAFSINWAVVHSRHMAAIRSRLKPALVKLRLNRRLWHARLIVSIRSLKNCDRVAMHNSPDLEYIILSRGRSRRTSLAQGCTPYRSTGRRDMRRLSPSSSSVFFIVLPTALDVIKSHVLVNLAALQSSRVTPEAALADQLLVVLTRNNKPTCAGMPLAVGSSYFG